MNEKEILLEVARSAALAAEEFVNLIFAPPVALRGSRHGCIGRIAGQMRHADLKAPAAAPS